MLWKYKIARAMSSQTHQRAVAASGIPGTWLRPTCEAAMQGELPRLSKLVRGHTAAELAAIGPGFFGPPLAYAILYGQLAAGKQRLLSYDL